MLTEFLIAHMIGDYLLQNDWVALKKKQNSFVCLLHVFLYLTPFVGILFSYNRITFYDFNWFWFLLLVGIQHFLQDRWLFVFWWMGIIGQEQFRQPPAAPWSLFVVDNTLHLCFVLFLVRVFLV